MIKKKVVPGEVQRNERQLVRDDVPPIGPLLRRAREHNGLTIREVERRLNRSSAYLSQIERGVIRQPDPVALLELADLYKLDFMKLATWAGWASALPSSSGNATSASMLVRRILELTDRQRAEVLSHIEKLLKESRT